MSLSLSDDRLRVVVLWPKWLWQRKQSPTRRHQVWAVERRDDVELKITGPGWPDWDDDASGMYNIESLLPDCQVAWGYKMNGTEKSPPVGNMAEVSANVLTVEGWNECWPGTADGFKAAMHPGGGTAAQECIEAHLGMAICHHPNDVPRMQAAADAGTRIVHIPHCAERTMFYRPDVAKKCDVVLTGVQNATQYPLRAKWLKILPRLSKNHYSLQRCPNWVESVERAEELTGEYASALARSKIKLGCASRWKYPLAHYPEAAMAGCLVVADMPEQAPDGYGEMVAAVGSDWTLSELEQYVQGLLADGALPARMRAAQQAALRHFSMERYADDFVRLCRETIGTGPLKQHT